MVQLHRLKSAWLFGGNIGNLSVAGCQWRVAQERVREDDRVGVHGAFKSWIKPQAMIQ